MYSYDEIQLSVDEIKEILKYTDLGFDYEKDEIKAYIYGFQEWGTSLLITNGEKEWFLRITTFSSFYIPQFEERVYLADEAFDAIVTDLSAKLNTKFAPSTGGSEVVSVAVLAAGASLLGAVAGVVLSRKKGSAK